MAPINKTAKPVASNVIIKTEISANGKVIMEFNIQAFIRINIA
jgi:hypothetical protein